MKSGEKQIDKNIKWHLWHRVYGRKEDRRTAKTIYNNNEQDQTDRGGQKREINRLKEKRVRKKKTSPASSGRWAVNKVSLSAS